MKGSNMKNRKTRKLEFRDDGPGLERRNYNVSELRVVRDDGEEPTKIVGHSAVFGEWSEDLGGFREKIRPGAFLKSIKDDDIRALWNHNTDYVLGRNKVSKTLTLREDKTGLAIEIIPPDTQFARDFMVSIERGDVSQMSFGFYVQRDEWNYPEKENELAERELLEVELFDVSPVTYPAYPQTDVSVRSMDSGETLTVDELIRKADAGEELTDEEMERVDNAIEALQGIGGPPVPDNADSEDGEDASQCQDLARLKLAIDIEQEL